MQLQCNGKNKCLNEVDLESLFRERQANGAPKPYFGVDMPMRLVLKCQHCSEGRVVVTGDMLWNLHFQVMAGQD